MAKDELERRSVALEGLKVERRDGQEPKMRGHAAVFGQLSQDLGGFREQIAPGTFAESIKNDDIRALFNHDDNFVLGRNRSNTLALGEDSRGLAIEITPPDTTWARDLVTSMDRGDINQMSFAFSVRPNGENWAKDDNGQWVRTLTRVRLFDVSPVTFPAYQQTDVAMRSLTQFQQTLPPASVPLSILKRKLDLIAL